MRLAWRGRILPGKEEEYRRRHDEIDPELVREMRVAGVRNYTIFLSGDEVFGYFEFDDPARLEPLAQSAAAAAWQRTMEGVIELRLDPARGELAALEEVFRLD